jgi:lipopolysaccharide/colanic/teichoic acid biosynthesis glycosyltransferase
MKRFFDIIFSCAGLIFFSPVVIVITCLIKLEDGGPIFYAGSRVGKNRLMFKMLKFRTMVTNADKIGGPSTSNDDPRITRVGKLIRKFKLDEIPQLINVLKGEMSFVGPRPEVAYYVNMFSSKEMKILSIRPGITDWASIWNSDEGSVLAGSSDPEKTYMEKIRPEKIRLQLDYVGRRSLWVDFKIIIRTIMKIIK